MSRTGAFRARLVYDFGGAELTSITAYRYNKYTRGQDADFNNLDILYRDDDGGAYNQFKTFTQESGSRATFGNHLDWLIGGYYADEKLTVRDNLAYGADYYRYSNCLVAANFAGATGQAAPLSPDRRPASTRPSPARFSRSSAANTPYLRPSHALARSPASTTAGSAISRRARSPGADDERCGPRRSL